MGENTVFSEWVKYLKMNTKFVDLRSIKIDGNDGVESRVPVLLDGASIHSNGIDDLVRPAVRRTGGGACYSRHAKACTIARPHMPLILYERLAVG